MSELTNKNVGMSRSLPACNDRNGQEGKCFNILSPE